MIGQLIDFDQAAKIVGGIYIFIGIIGFLCNIATLIMITSQRMYRLSTYTIMANLALADAIMLIVAGFVCGLNIIQVSFFDDYTVTNNFTDFLDQTELHLNLNASKFFSENKADKVAGSFLRLPKLRAPMNSKFQFDTFSKNLHFSIFLLSFFEIAAWTAGMISYAFLGINRCVAICFYRTRAKAINCVSSALIGSLITWFIGIISACIGTMPVPLMGIRTDMWTVSFLSIAGKRPTTFMILESFLNFASILVQWSCSVMVLMKIHKVRQKINCNKLNINSANRFKKQARLTFQFFYPSLICTISSTIFFIKPFVADVLSSWQFVFLHLVWLCNHLCNPFIYAYFNERMRLSYGQWLTCNPLRQYIHKYRKQYWRRHGRRLRISKCSNTHLSGNKNLQRRSRNQGNGGDFVRSSLQMQSRNFEQLCEFMMRVNPVNDSSEGWTESSSDLEADQNVTAAVLPNSPSSSLHANRRYCHNNQQQSQSLVFKWGRQTMEHWASFTKKASF